MNTECFVPNCKSSEGVPFPNDPADKSAWLEGLLLPDVEPPEGAIVCAAHFNTLDLDVGVDGRTVVKEGAVPKLELRDDVDGDNGQEKLDTEDCERPTDNNEAAHVSASNLMELEKVVEIITKEAVAESNETASHTQFEVEASEITKHADITNSTCMKNATIRSYGSHSELSNKVEIDDTPKPVKMCRVCLTEDNIAKHIFDSFDGESSVISVLTHCAYPLQIKKTDNYPKHICRKCLQLLTIAHRFREKCLRTDDTLKRICQKVPRKINHNSCEESEQPSKKIPKVTQTQCKPINVYDDLIEKSMEEIHREAVSDIVPEDMEVDSPQTLNSILATLEGNSELKPKGKGRFANSTNPMQVTMVSKHSIVTTSTRKNLEPNYKSKIGKFGCENIHSVLGYTFCLIEGYIFESGLSKGLVRHLKCIIATCKSTAEQSYIGDSLENYATVTTPHNHPPPDKDNMKKQMLLNVIRKKLQSDRSINIRNLYEEISEQEPILKTLVPFRSVMNEICKHQVYPHVSTFEEFYQMIETSRFERLHFTHNCQQFYQEKFATEDGAMAVVFANCDVVQQVSNSDLMYVDATFRIDSSESFHYQLVTVLVWVDNSYYPIAFAMVNRKTREIFKKIFKYLYEELAPELRPKEIVTDYEASIYYALGETYLESHIGGSVFYFTENIYKKVCSLNLSRQLETNSYFRNIYHMLLMLPLLPVNTITDGLNNIEVQAKDMDLYDSMKPIFNYIKEVWIKEVTPELFCVHRLENRINENVVAPFKKLRDFLLLTKGKLQKTQVTIGAVVEKIIDLEYFLQNVYSKPEKKSFGRDLSSFQKKNVLRAWHYIENHPKININNFFSKVLGYIKCMENQLWIWGFYRHSGDTDEPLINASNFSIVGSPENPVADEQSSTLHLMDDLCGDSVVLEAVVDEGGEIVLQRNENVVAEQTPKVEEQKEFAAAFMKFVFP